MNNIKDYEGGNMTQIQTREFFKQVYTYMALALGISGVIAFYCGTPDFFAKYLLNSAGTGLSPIFWVIAFAPLGLGLVIQMAYLKLSMGALTALFVAYSVLMGLSLSSVFLIYSTGSIASTFLITAGAFAGMAILGFTTKVDLTKMGSLLYMVFIGMFIAGIVNIWMKSDFMGYIISILGVFVFTGLIAYEMQNLKHIAQEPGFDGMTKQKLALVGGLKLYILFVNLFLSLLRLFGSRD